MDWLKIHHEARTDKKLAKLSAHQFRVWFNLLLLASEQKQKRGTIDTSDMYIVTLEVCNEDEDLLRETLALLAELHIVTFDGSEITFIDFQKQQSAPSSKLVRASWNVVSKKIRKAIFERDGKVCRYCGSETFPEIDHVHPVYHGGPTTPENLQVLCRPCNRKKGKRLSYEVVF